MDQHKHRIEPFLFAILVRRFDFITKEMTNTLLRAGRSGVVNTGHDFSCATVDNQHRVVSVADGSPCHIGAAGLQTEILEDLFGDDIHPGDAFINTCSYYGNTHNGDFTIFAPVFYKGERLFYTLTRAHQADIGAPISQLLPGLLQDHLRGGTPTALHADPEGLSERGGRHPHVQGQDPGSGTVVRRLPGPDRGHPDRRTALHRALREVRCGNDQGLLRRVAGVRGQVHE